MAKGHEKLSHERPAESRDLWSTYLESKYLSIKHDSYFPVYEDVMSKYVGRPVTLVEIGVLNGGSLFMWRGFLGPHARIIGIDLNPAATKWQECGFEIFIGDQQSPDFWRATLREIGEIDIVIDDGGHTNAQQIVTVELVLPNIRDGGILVVEDVHASYLAQFGNPSRWSFISYAKRIVDRVNRRAADLGGQVDRLSQVICSVHFHTSLTVFHVDRRRCAASHAVSNGGESMNAADLRYAAAESARLVRLLRRLAPTMMRLPFGPQIAPSLGRLARYCLARFEDRRTHRYFR